MVILGLDLETTGLSVDSCDIVEIGVAKYDPDFNKIFNQGSIVVKSDKITDESASINGLTLEFVDQYGLKLNDALASLIPLIETSDYICAHNGNNFDKLVLENNYKRFGTNLDGIKWIDTRTDLPLPESFKGRSLIHMAADHNVYYPKSQRHTALSDVNTMLQILMMYDIDPVIKRAGSPGGRIIATIERERNDVVKKNRFRWDPINKYWFRDIKEIDFESLKLEYPFEVRFEKEKISG